MDQEQGPAERLRVLQEEYSKLQALTDNLGWKDLETLADEQVKLRIPSALGKVDNLLEITKKEYEKGEIAGIQLFTQLPGIRLEAIRLEMAQLEEELGYDRAERTDDGSDGDSDGGDFKPAV